MITSAPKINLEELFGKQNKQDERFFSKPIVNVHEFYLSGTIESSDEYIQWFDTIRHAGPNDAVKFYINSYGGDVFTAIQFMKALNETSAAVIMSVEGACMSAATMIFLTGQTFEVAEHSMFMFHNYSGGTMGKGGEMLDQLKHERAWSEKLLRDVYMDFLTEQEIVSILDNKDIWMDGEEVIKRLKIKKAAVEAEEADKDEDNIEEIEVPKPSKKKKEPK
jgi:ATP-dependent protease ClpP protease subunit